MFLRSIRFPFTIFKPTSLKAREPFKQANQELKWEVQLPGIDKQQQHLEFWCKVIKELKGTGPELAPLLEGIRSQDIIQSNLEFLQWKHRNSQKPININQEFNQILLGQLKYFQYTLRHNPLPQSVYDNFITELNNYTYLSKPFHFVSGSILQFLHEYFNHFGPLDSKALRLVLFHAELLKDQVQLLSTDSITLYLFHISKLNIAVQSFKLYFELFISFAQKMSAVWDQFTPLQMKSLLYTLGKHGIYDLNIQSKLEQKLAEPLQLNNENDLKMAVNYLLCTTNIIFSQENKADFLPYIRQLVTHVPNYAASSSQSIANMYQCIIRCLIFDEEIWAPLVENFSLLTASIQKSNLCYQMGLLVDEFSPRIQAYIRNSILPVMQALQKDLDRVRRDEHRYFEQQISSELKRLEIPFIQNLVVEGSEFDFYFQEKKLILEVAGPLHYNFKIQPEATETSEPFLINNKVVHLEQKESLVSRFKMHKLRKQGYNIKVINFVDLRKNNIQTLLLEALI